MLTPMMRIAGIAVEKISKTKFSLIGTLSVSSPGR
jgi:hypothetical protein